MILVDIHLINHAGVYKLVASGPSGSAEKCVELIVSVPGDEEVVGEVDLKVGLRKTFKIMCLDLPAQFLRKNYELAQISAWVLLSKLVNILNYINTFRGFLDFQNVKKSL